MFTTKKYLDLNGLFTWVGHDDKTGLNTYERVTARRKLAEILLNNHF